MISTPIIAWLVLRWGWRCPFIIMGLLGLLWLAGWSFLLSAAERGGGEIAATGASRNCSAPAS